MPEGTAHESLIIYFLTVPKITTLSAAVIALAASAAIGQDRVTLHRVAEAGILGSVSSNGRFISYVDTVDGDDHVFVRDLKTGENRCLTEGPGEAGWSVSSAISPDAKQVAYDWVLGDEGEWLELRVIGVDGSGLRVLYRNNDLLNASAEAWSPDGRHILATLLRKNLTYQIVLVSVSDGAVRVLKSQRLKTLRNRKEINYQTWLMCPGWCNSERPIAPAGMHPLPS